MNVKISVGHQPESKQPGLHVRRHKAGRHAHAVAVHTAGAHDGISCGFYRRNTQLALHAIDGSGSTPYHFGDHIFSAVMQLYPAMQG